MVEALADVLQVDFLPAACCMAGRASLRETAVVGVFVAVGAEVERDAEVTRFAVVPIDMALGALDLRVLAGQRITRLAVIELTDVNLLPVDEVVAGLAGRTEASFVEIFVAGNAGGSETEISSVQVFVFDCAAFLRGDM